MSWALTSIQNGIPFVAAACGLISAGYWYLASRVEIAPLWQKLGTPEPVVQELRESGWIHGIIEAGTESARLNKIAAIWTAVAVFLGSVSAFLPKP
ncbi:hypothetical protein [Tardiphaga sp. P9-11]|uniref:hypothetical protein n=1 Tax=Tardiphaga sp. P9-11 TaxID=2024614 RepID=UPI0011F2145E|nr:hypothetical protein [Tardiphaga sp. P9-11]